MKALLGPAVLTILMSVVSVVAAAEGKGASSDTSGTTTSQSARYSKQKVVYHINYYGAKQQAAALANIQNHINAVGKENLDLKVVLHGNGISLLLEPDGLEGTKMQEANATDVMQAKISGLKDQGVAFNVCANTLKGRKVGPVHLYDLNDGDIVPSGVAELAYLQGQGYSYIKP